MIFFWSASANKDSDTSSEIKQENTSQKLPVLPLRCAFLSFHRIFTLKTVRAVMAALSWHRSSIFSLLEFDLRDLPYVKVVFPMSHPDMTSACPVKQRFPSPLSHEQTSKGTFPTVQILITVVQTIIPLIILQWTMEQTVQEFQWLTFLQWRK